MKKTKVIIPALGILLLSTAASVTGTVAWFSMNNSVSATGMNIQAKAEDGIVISNEAKTTWRDTVAATHTTAISVFPTSTTNGTLWVHSASNDANSFASTGKYDKLTLANDDGSSGTGAGYVDANSNSTLDTGEACYYLKNSFFIKSSAVGINNQTIYVTHVKAEITGTNSRDLDKSLRVLIVQGSATKVYAPVAPTAAADLTYSVCTDLYTAAAATQYNTDHSLDADDEDYKHENDPIYTSFTAIDSSASEGKVPSASQEFVTTNIPGFASDSPLQFDVYIYFEGEDVNCKSANLAATLDSINVSVKFGLQQVA